MCIVRDKTVVHRWLYEVKYLSSPPRTVSCPPYRTSDRFFADVGHTLSNTSSAMTVHLWRDHLSLTQFAKPFGLIYSIHLIQVWHPWHVPARYVLFVVISFCPGTQSAASQFIPSISDTPPAADWGWGVLQARTWFRQMHRLGSSAVIILLSIWRAWITRSALSALHELMVDDSHWQTHCAAAAAALLWRRRAVVRLQRVCDIEPAMHSVCIAAPHC